MQIQSPSNTDPYKMALAHHQKKEYAKAKNLYLTALQQQPRKAEAWVNLASVCDALGVGAEALLHIERALSLNSRVRDGYFNKGVILHHLHRLLEAIDAFQMSLQYSPDDHDAYYYLGQCYFSLGRLDLALDAYKKASDIRPTLASIYAAGWCYEKMNRLTAAIICLNECIKINPQYTLAQFKLVSCYKKLQDYSKLKMVLSSLQSMMHLSLGDQQELFFEQQGLSIWLEEPHFKQQLVQATEHHLENATAIPPINPWRSIILPLCLSSRLSLAQKFSANIEKKYQPQKYTPITANAQSGRLRIGYLSMDFRIHATGFLMQSFFALHDRARFEVFAYSYGFNDNSAVRKAIEQGVDHFVDIETDDIITAANKIAADGIDILIDLAGFTTDNRFAILALRPAPIQVNYLGYCLSTGSQSIDYFLGDKTIIHKEEEPSYSEKIIYLPHTFIAINHQEKIRVELAGTRADWGLANDVFVYGCFNTTYKIEPDVFDAWMEILKAVPRSLLWLLSCHEIIETNLRNEAQKRGVDPERLVFSPDKDRAEHLARHQHLDLFLDTWQVNAVTTACDAIYAGVPVLTLAGDYILSRAAKSIMQAAGPLALTQEFIASNKEDYIQKAIHFGLHADKFSALKKVFQNQLPDSPLLDMPGRIKSIEAAYEKMWALHQQNLAPQTFSVE